MIDFFMQIMQKPENIVFLFACGFTYTIGSIVVYNIERFFIFIFRKISGKKDPMSDERMDKILYRMEWFMDSWDREILIAGGWNDEQINDLKDQQKNRK